MIQVDIEKYFRPRGIDVSYNTLGGEESLYRAYVNQFQTIVDNTKMGMSHHVKHHCYNQLYQIEPRQKLTGFENYKDIDKSFRERARKEISLIDWVDSIDILKSENKLETPERIALKLNKLLSFDYGDEVIFSLNELII